MLYEKANYSGMLGTGDMLKGVYDTNDDGIVNGADSVPWDGVEDTPTTLAGYGIENAYTKSEVDDLLENVEIDVDSALSDSSENPVQNKVIKSALDNKAEVIVDTASGSMASFPDGADADVVGLVVGIEPVQDLHGYENPWPAGGGKNKLPLSDYTTISNGITYTVTADGKVIANGTASQGTSALYFYGNTGKSFPAGNYILSGCPTGGGTETYSIRQTNNGTYVGQDSGNGRSLEIAQNDSIVFYIRIAQGVSVSNLVFEPMLRLASVADATYAPYTNICPISGWTGVNVVVSPTTDAQDGTTYPITFPAEAGTVYGGTLDVTTGELTVSRAFVTVTSCAAIGNANIAQLDINGVKIPANADTPTGAITSYLPSKSRNEVVGDTTLSGIMCTDAGNLWIRIPNLTTKEDYDAYLTANPLQVCYELATPQTYTLTPQTVRTLLGANNIFADTGDVEVTYKADTKLYADKKLAKAESIRLTIAPVETGTTASQAYAQGAYFFLNDSFCKAKTAIASGATFTLNTNYQITTVAAELLAAQN